MNERPFTAETIRRRFTDEAFARPLIDNSVRGLWCEYMLAEALGPDCRTTGFAWHPWDLQIGPDTSDFPARIRIQVKNSAALQNWNAASGRQSEPSFNLTWRKRPAYWERDSAEVPCEEVGFLCDIFLLCHHPETEVARADHREPAQWQVFLLPVRGPNDAVTPAERRGIADRLATTGKPSSTQRRPRTLIQGIRGRPACQPIHVPDLTVNDIRRALGLSA